MNKKILLGCWRTIKLIVGFTLSVRSSFLHFAKLNGYGFFLSLSLTSLVVLFEVSVFFFKFCCWNQRAVLKLHQVCKQERNKKKKSTRHVYRLTLIRKRYSLNTTWWRIKHEWGIHWMPLSCSQIVFVLFPVMLLLLLLRLLSYTPCSHTHSRARVAVFIRLLCCVLWCVCMACFIFSIHISSVVVVLIGIGVFMCL